MYFIFYYCTSNSQCLGFCRYIEIPKIKKMRQFQTEMIYTSIRQHIPLRSITMSLLRKYTHFLLSHLPGPVHLLQQLLAFCHQLRESGTIQSGFCRPRKSVPEQLTAVQAVRVQVPHSHLAALLPHLCWCPIEEQK